MKLWGINRHEIDKFILSKHLRGYPTLVRIEILRDNLAQDATNLRRLIEANEVQISGLTEAREFAAAELVQQFTRWCELGGGGRGSIEEGNARSSLNLLAVDTHSLTSTRTPHLSATPPQTAQASLSRTRREKCFSRESGKRGRKSP